MQSTKGSRRARRGVGFGIALAIAVVTALAGAAGSFGHGFFGHGFFGHGRTDWPISRYDLGRDAFNQQERILSPSTVSHLRLAWTFNTRLEADSSIVVVDGTAYFGSDSGYLFAADAQTGATRWISPNAAGENTTPAVSGDVVYILGGGDATGAAGNLTARNRYTGAILWSSPMPKPYASLSSPEIVGPPVRLGRSAHSRRHERARPDATIYAAGTHGVYAFDAVTGAQLWMVPTAATVASSPAIDGGTLFASTGATVYAIDLATHAVKWTYTTGGAAATPGPSIAASHGLVYVPANNALNALDERTGAVRWQAPNTGLRGSSPAVADGIVYVGSTDHSLHAYDAATGAVKWTFATQANIAFSSPTVADGVVYTGSYDGLIYALNARTGAKLWSDTTGGIIESSPTVVDGMLFFGSNDYLERAYSLTGHAAEPPLAAGCLSSNGLFIPPKGDMSHPGGGLIPGICRFTYKPGETYSASGPFSITCANGATFTTAGLNLPLTGCSGVVSVVTVAASGQVGAPGGGIAVAGDTSPTEPAGSCDAACLARVNPRNLAAIATNPPQGVAPPPWS